MNGKVIALSLSHTHSFSKPNQESIKLLTGLGVEGDTHLGEKVQHRSRVKQNPDQPNLRQVHLIHAELHDELQAKGFEVSAGQMGENITTRGIDLLGLPTAAKLYVGSTAIIEVTGLRNPCHQLDDFQSGLMKAVLEKDEQGNLIRKAGIMGVVLMDGEIHVDDLIRVELPPEPHQPLQLV
jgi:MOSC domain-containing protein YiiM